MFGYITMKFFGAKKNNDFERKKADYEDKIAKMNKILRDYEDPNSEYKNLMTEEQIIKQLDKLSQDYAAFLSRGGTRNNRKTKRRKTKNRKTRRH